MPKGLKSTHQVNFRTSGHTVEPAMSSNSYDQPASYGSYEATWSFPKMTFCIQINLL